MSVTTFISLPEDLHIRILAELNGKSIVRCAMTCKTLYETLRNSLVLEYRIQLYFDGLEDAGTSTSSVASLISNLRHYREACSMQKWSRFIDTFAFSSRYKSHHLYKFGGGAISVTNGDRLETVWLPNGRTGKGLVTIEHKLSTDGVAVFCMDPTQDVMAILECVYREDPGAYDGYIHELRIFIRTLSTNTDHPLANMGVLDIPDVVKIQNPKLEVSHNTLVLWTCDYMPRVLIWDWKTGQRLRNLNLNAPESYGHIHDFGLLGSSDFAFLTRPAGFGSIEIYRLKHDAHLATLHFPSYSRGTTVTSVNITSYSNPVHVHQAPYGPFIVDTEEQIYAFEVYYKYSSSKTGFRHFSMTMYAHQRIFMKYCTHEAAWDQPAVDVPWEEWGPANTAIDKSYPSYGPRPIHGQRILCTTRPDHYIEMKDFTLGAVLAADDAPWMFSLEERKLAGRLIRYTKIYADEVPIFANDLEGRLPYVSYLFIEHPIGDISHYLMIMMCEEGIKPDDDDVVKRNRMYIYSPLAL
ncbi:hypothetical protein BDN70DRAFT_924891 [Pholiota conissans]|uniref:F-box domain-containing protein n=1 Tax=Pholiota conissans TaxID=109636 RepID=A0A9P6CPI0_9AGAR|nr:hypothetical protein BDN70DRAFT_924891 [Pholiota conissans]